MSFSHFKDLIIKELKGYPGVGIHYFPDDAFGFGVHADELAFRDDNFATHLFQGHDLAELGFLRVSSRQVLPVVP